jgi:hypothetical protein
MADPTQTNITQTTIPDYAKPYVESMLGQGQALTDLNQNPYMQYQGERVAQFTPLQQQAYQNAGLMQTAPQLQDASAMAGMAGLGGLNTQYTFQPSNFSSANASSLMNPYMQNVVDIQKREASRASGIQGAQQGAQAAGVGAFGGSRDAIMAAERQRNLGQQMNDIQATGSNAAFNQAMQQYNTQNQLNAQQQQFGAGLGLQGLQTANQAASNLSNIGNTQYNQNMGINQMQNLYGGQQQQQVQNVLNNQYQDYLGQQNYPYQQLSFMSNLLRGLPMTNQTAQVYQQPPSMLSQVAGAGITAKALGAFKDGGSVKSDGLAGLALAKMA